MTNALIDTGFAPLVKWPGGKRREWRQIAPHVPADVRNFVDPFMGGLAPFAMTPFSGRAWLNDRHERLVDLHGRVQASDSALFEAAEALGRDWDALGSLATDVRDEFGRLVGVARAGDKPQSKSDVRLPLESVPVAAFGDGLRASLSDKARRVARLEVRHDVTFDADALTDHAETAVRAAFYTLVRASHASPGGAERTAEFLFVREFCYGSMFRTNSRGEFNIPYGGTSYNGKSFLKRCAQLRSPAVSEALARATFSCGDFEAFLDEAAGDLDARDFVFLDPPYHSDFSTYGPNAFELSDHERLAEAIARCPARWLLVIKVTPDVRRIYADGAPKAAGAREVLTFGKTYGYNVRGRNERDTEHIMLAKT